MKKTFIIIYLFVKLVSCILAQEKVRLTEVTKKDYQDFTAKYYSLAEIKDSQIFYVKGLIIDTFDIVKLKKFKNLVSIYQCTKSPSCMDSVIDIIAYNNIIKKFEGIAIKYLPNNIGKLTQLKWLILNDCLIDSLPQSIGNLSKLEYIDLCLESRQFSFKNKMKLLPSSFANLQNLQYLYLCRNSFIKFPEEICRLKHLRGLNIAKNAIDSIPNCICNLDNVRISYDYERINIDKISCKEIFYGQPKVFPLTKEEKRQLKKWNKSTLLYKEKKWWQFWK
jgi:Leucine-rich repeat (LRR) protein